MKKCFQCGEEKPLSSFYVHKMMADGHLNKCIVCVKLDVSARIEKKKQDPAWMAQERTRCREKQERYRKLGVAKQRTPEAARKWDRKNAHKKRAHGEANRAVKAGRIKKKTACESCGASGVRLEKHHPDYSKPLEVQWLCTKCHGITRRK